MPTILIYCTDIFSGHKALRLSNCFFSCFVFWKLEVLEALRLVLEALRLFWFGSIKFWKHCFGSIKTLRLFCCGSIKTFKLFFYLLERNWTKEDGISLRAN